MHKNLIILAGGASSRMKTSSTVKELSQQEKSEADSKSKSLIRLGKDKRPFLDYLLLNAKSAGFEHIHIVTGEENDHFKQYYNSGSKHKDFAALKVSFAVQYIPEGRIKPFGTADAVTQTLDQFPNLQETKFTVCNSDNLYSVSVMKTLRNDTSENALIAYDRDALQFSGERIAKFAIIDIDKEYKLKSIIEKPDIEGLERYSDNNGIVRVSMNIFNFSGPVTYKYFKNCPVSSRNEKEIASVLNNILLDRKGTISCIPFSEHVPDLTSKEDIIIMKEYLSKHFPDF